MEKWTMLLEPLFAGIIGLFLLLKPKPIIKIIGKIYWHLAKFTAIGKSEKTKSYFFSENTIWFRIIGIIMLLIAFSGVVARIN